MTSDEIPAGPWSRARDLDRERPPAEKPGGAGNRDISAAGTEATAPAGPSGAPDHRGAGRAPRTTRTEFVGRRGRLFALAIKTGVLTVLSLGLYRFWMKTRLRRWYWSAIRPAAYPLEYVGDPWEKLLGFLFAVVVLAFYIGIVNLVLMFASFALFSSNIAAYALSLIGVVPLWFFAQYRARRYVLARSRWRGLRFGLAPGAWGYAWRAMLYWSLSIATAGILLPLMTYRLEAYRAERTFYGEARMQQGGRWTMLYPAMMWLIFAACLAGIAAISAARGDPDRAVLWSLAAVCSAIYGITFYQVETLKRLTSSKRIAGARLALTASPLKVFWIRVSGYGLTLLILAVPVTALGALVVAVQPEILGTETIPGLPEMDGLDRWLVIPLSVLLYFTTFLLWSGLTHVLVTMPTLRHYAEGLRLIDAERLERVRQRPRDAHSEAEGFAEALDVGAAI